MQRSIDKMEFVRAKRNENGGSLDLVQDCWVRSERVGFWVRSDKGVTEQMTPSRPTIPWESAIVFLFVGSFVLFLARDRALVWDEGMTLERVDLLADGLTRLVDGRIDFISFTKHYWRFSRAEPDGHGPFYALLSGLGRALTGGFLPPALSFRVGPIVLFAFAVASLSASLRHHLGPLGRATAIFLLVLLPRLLPEVSFALIDGPLVSLSLLAFASFLRAVDTNSSAWAIAWGVAIGSAMATKLTGWFFPIPYVIGLASVAWASQGRWSLRPVLLGSLALVAAVLLWNDGWWPDLAGGITAYFESNLTRQKTIPIPILFLGTRYDFSLPWYNTLVWIVFALPVGTMMLGLGGLLACMALSPRDPFARLLALNSLLLLVLRSLPQAPGHDGTRQIIVCFAFLAIVAGWSIDRLHRFFSHPSFGWRGRWVAPLLALASAGESASGILHTHPLELSYYSPLVGGLPGADRLGMEPTYFWDSLTSDARAWLREHTPPNESILFRNYTPSWRYLHAWGEIPPPFTPGGLPPRWFVLQHRPGQYDAVDRLLIASFIPAFQKKQDDVPLLSIFDIRDWQQARTQVAPSPAKVQP